jgi:hypothetical protein
MSEEAAFWEAAAAPASHEDELGPCDEAVSARVKKVYKAIQGAVVARLEGKLPHQKKKVESPLSSLWLTLGDAELNMFALENAELRAYWSALLDMSVRPTRARLLPQRTQPQFPCLMFGGSFHGPRSSGPCSFHVTSTIEPRMR